MVMKKNSKEKGKQRASTISLVPSEFLKAQIDALNAPLDDLACEDYARENDDDDDQDAPPIDQKVLDKAVRAINKQLVTARSKKLPESALDAIAEQLQFLRAQQQGAAEQQEARLDQVGTIGIDREYWLESLPAQWPEANEADTEAGDEDLREQYTQLITSTRALKSKHHILEQKTAHYEKLLAILEDEVDIERLKLLLSNQQSKKRKKQLNDSEKEEEE